MAKIAFGEGHLKLSSNREKFKGQTMDESENEMWSRIEKLASGSQAGGLTTLDLAALKYVLNHRINHEPASPRQIIDAFHKQYYDSQVWSKTWWKGTPLLKCPMDLWIYQEIIHATQPDLIIETGSFRGGSAFYMAELLGGKGIVISIDIQTWDRTSHKDVVFLQGSSIDPAVIDQVKTIAGNHKRIMVILDSDHSRDHVLAELQTYAMMVTPGCYLIIEDTNINGRPVFKEHGPGPAEAREAFMLTAPPFSIDASMEKFGMTFNPGGYLKRN